MNLVEDVLNPKQHKPSRNGFGTGLLELGEENANVWALSADVSESTRTHLFAEKFPERFVQVGVAEQNLAGVAAGIAACGKTAFISAYGVFSPGRNWDQIRVSICYNDVNVNMHASHTGLTVGPDGASHQALEDLALVRSLPNITVFSAADMEEARKITHEMATIKTPCYLRTSREKAAVFTTKDTPFKPGKANVYREGSDVAIFAHGFSVYESLLAAEILKKEGIDAAVVDHHTIKPLDRETTVNFAKTCGLIVTVEEHQISGGLGSAVAEALCEQYPCPVKRHGIYDRFCESGGGRDLLKKYLLDAEGIAKTVKGSMNMKDVIL